MTRDANDVLREHGVDALREAWDKAEVLRFEPKPSGQAPASERFPLVRFHDLRHSTSPACIVKGIVPRVGITAAWGPPKCGKSFAVYDLGMHVALGWEYRGRRVLSGAVVYFALEGGEGFKARADAYRQHHGIADDETVPFYLCTAPLNLVKEAGTLVDAIKQQLPDTSPRLVVIDTLNRSLPGSESRDEDMAAYLRAATMIVDAFKCAVIVITIAATTRRGCAAIHPCWEM